MFVLVCLTSFISIKIWESNSLVCAHGFTVQVKDRWRSQLTNERGIESIIFRTSLFADYKIGGHDSWGLQCGCVSY